jgi:CDP-diglyceride synthetase
MRNSQNETYKQDYSLTFVFLQVFDFITTFFLVYNYGFRYELNPLVRSFPILFLSLFVGVLGVPYFYKLSCKLSKNESMKRFTNWVMLIAIYTKILIVTNNFIQMFA